MLDRIDILIVILIVVILIVHFYKNKENYKYFKGEKYYFSRPNCAQLNKYKTCVNTPGCRYINQSRDNIDLSVAGNMPGVGGEGCINHYEDLRDENIPDWEKNNFLVVRD